MQQGLPSFNGQIAVLGSGPAIGSVGARQLVDQFVADVAGMAFHPSKVDGAFPFGDFGIDGLDQFNVFHRLLLRIPPAVSFPALHPLGGAVDGVLRIGFDEQRLGAGVRAQGFEHGAQFPNLIGAVGGATVVVPALIVMVPFRAAGVLGMIGPCPSHGTVGIAQCRAVCGDRNRHAYNPTKSVRRCRMPSYC